MQKITWEHIFSKRAIKFYSLAVIIDSIFMVGLRCTGSLSRQDFPYRKMQRLYRNIAIDLRIVETLSLWQFSKKMEPVSLHNELFPVVAEFLRLVQLAQPFEIY